MTDAAPGWWRRRNWWKIGFFTMLIAFELTREVAVVEAGEGAQPNAMAFMSGPYFGQTTATGQWTRIDGGGSLVPSTTRVNCNENRGECIEVTTSAFDQYFGAPEIDRFDAKFSSDAITYENDVPECAKYSVRLDLKLKKVLAVRDRKPNPKGMCNNLEPRIESTLGEGPPWSERDPTKGHFVPMLSLIRMMVN